MRAYIIATGIIFALVALAHVLRVGQEGIGLIKNPWFIFTTAVCTGFCGWAWRLLRARSKK